MWNQHDIDYGGQKLKASINLWVFNSLKVTSQENILHNIFLTSVNL